jgi:hypothetical protein
MTNTTEVAGKVDGISRLNSYDVLDKKTGKPYKRSILNVYILTQKDLYGVVIDEKSQYVLHGQLADDAFAALEALNPDAIRKLKDIKKKPEMYCYLGDLNYNKDKEGKFYRTPNANQFVKLTKTQFTKMQAGMKKASQNIRSIVKPVTTTDFAA